MIDLTSMAHRMDRRSALCDVSGVDHSVGADPELEEPRELASKSLSSCFGVSREPLDLAKDAVSCRPVEAGQVLFATRSEEDGERTWLYRMRRSTSSSGETSPSFSAIKLRRRRSRSSGLSSSPASGSPPSRRTSSTASRTTAFSSSTVRSAILSPMPSPKLRCSTAAVYAAAPDANYPPVFLYALWAIDRSLGEVPEWLVPTGGGVPQRTARSDAEHHER